MSKRTLFVALAFVVIGFAYWALSPLFITVKIDEAAPVGAAAGVLEQTAAAEVVGTTGHQASGGVRIVRADGKTFVRYENYKTINGPDLFVYLAKDIDAREFINLGALKATEGNVNYEVPANINTEEYPYVLTWCRAFGVLFNYAKIQ